MDKKKESAHARERDPDLMFSRCHGKYVFRLAGKAAALRPDYKDKGPARIKSALISLDVDELIRRVRRNMDLTSQPLAASLIITFSF